MLKIILAALAGETTDDATLVQAIDHMTLQILLADYASLVRSNQEKTVYYSLFWLSQPAEPMSLLAKIVRSDYNRSTLLNAILDKLWQNIPNDYWLSFNKQGCCLLQFLLERDYSRRNINKHGLNQLLPIIEKLAQDLSVSLLLSAPVNQTPIFWYLLNLFRQFDKEPNSANKLYPLIKKIISELPISDLTKKYRLSPHSAMHFLLEILEKNEKEYYELKNLVWFRLQTWPYQEYIMPGSQATIRYNCQRCRGANHCDLCRLLAIKSQFFASLAEIYQFKQALPTLTFPLMETLAVDATAAGYINAFLALGDCYKKKGAHKEAGKAYLHYAEHFATFLPKINSPTILSDYFFQTIMQLQKSSFDLAAQQPFLNPKSENYLQLGLKLAKYLCIEEPHPVVGQWTKTAIANVKNISELYIKLANPELKSVQNFGEISQLAGNFRLYSFEAYWNSLNSIIAACERDQATKALRDQNVSLETAWEIVGISREGKQRPRFRPRS